MKLCTKCKKSKPLTEFNKNKNTPDGYQYHCRACMREAYHKNGERNRAQMRKRAKEERDVRNEYRRRPERKEKIAEYTRENWDSIYSRVKEYREANKEELSVKAHIYYSENKDYINERQKKYVKKNPEKRKEIDKRRYQRLVSGRIEGEEIPSIEAIRDRDGDLCYYCKEPVVFLDKGPKAAEIDHKVPLFRGGADAMFNVVLACSTCNKEKHTKTEQEFLSFKERLETQQKEKHDEYPTSDLQDVGRNSKQHSS